MDKQCKWIDLPNFLEYASSRYAACSRLATLSSTLSICSKYGCKFLSETTTVGFLNNDTIHFDAFQGYRGSPMSKALLLLLGIRV